MTPHSPLPTPQPDRFDLLALSKPKPLALPATTAGYLFAAARTADAEGDSAARTYWLEKFQSHLDLEQS